MPAHRERHHEDAILQLTGQWMTGSCMAACRKEPPSLQLAFWVGFPSVNSRIATKQLGTYLYLAEGSERK